MFHIVYKTVNKINNKYYYGIHSTNNVDDGYLGSGTNIRRAIKKYGKDAFERKIICVFDDRTDALFYEKKIVSTELLNDESCYNIVEGGGDPPSRKGKVAPKTLLKGDQRTLKQKNATEDHSKNMKGRKAHNRKSVELFGKQFNTVTEAIKYYKLSTAQYYIMVNNPRVTFTCAEELKEYVWNMRNKKISESKQKKSGG